MTKNIPKIRFKGFSDSWEKCQMVNLTDTITDYVAAGSFSEIASHVEYLRVPNFAQLVRTTDLKHNFSNNDFVYVNKDAFLYLWRVNLNRECIIMPNIGVNCGEIYYVNPKKLPYKNNVLGPNAIFVRSEQNDNKFLSYIFKTQTFQKNLNFIISPTGKAKFNKTDLKKLFALIPQKTEQEKIGCLLNNIDKLITTNEQKLEKLKTIKTALLEKMFPQNNETTPKIRFKNFNDSWKRCELWEYTIWDKKFNEVESLKQPKIIKYPYLLADAFKKIEDSTGDVQLLSTGQYIGYTTKAKAGKYLCNGEVVTIPWGGVPNIKYFNGYFVTTDNRIATSINKELLDNKYLYYFMNSRISFIEGIYRGASIKHPSMNDLLNMTLLLPSIEEQKQIANTLTSLDNIIILHQQKLEKLKNIQTALLEKMFV